MQTSFQNDILFNENNLSLFYKQAQKNVYKYVSKY